MAKKYANKSWECFSEVYPGLIEECKEFIEELKIYSNKMAERKIILD